MERNKPVLEESAISYHLSIVIPAYNEEARIGASIDRIAQYLSGLDYQVELIIVDDGSSDSTREIVLGKESSMPPNCTLRLVCYSPNQGKGSTVRMGCLSALGKYVLFSDADLATPIEEWQRLEGRLEGGHDMAIGIRIWPNGPDMRSSQPLFRRLFGGAYHLLVVVFVVRGFPDTQCGFKAMTNEAAQRLFKLQSIKGIVFDTELLYLAKKLGMRVAQAPVSWSNVGGSRMRVTLDQAVRVFVDLLSIRLIHLRNSEVSDGPTAKRLAKRQ